MSGISQIVCSMFKLSIIRIIMNKFCDSFYFMDVTARTHRDFFNSFQKHGGILHLCCYCYKFYGWRHNENNDNLPFRHLMNFLLFVDMWSLTEVFFSEWKARRDITASIPNKHLIPTTGTQKYLINQIIHLMNEGQAHRTVKKRRCGYKEI